MCVYIYIYELTKILNFNILKCKNEQKRGECGHVTTELSLLLTNGS